MTPPLLVTVDVEGVVKAEDFGSIDRLNRLLDVVAAPVTLFVTPAVVRHRPAAVESWLAGDHHVALHVHPGRLGGESDWLASYDRPAIGRFIDRGLAAFADELGVQPEGFRAGRWSFSADVLAACADTGLSWDASLRPSRSRDPYRASGVVEYPMSVYGTALTERLLRSYGIDSVPLHADALTRSRLRALLLYATTARITVSGRPYVMVSFHDYDLTDDAVYRRIERYLTRLLDWLPARTVPEIPVGRNVYSDG